MSEQATSQTNVSSAATHPPRRRSKLVAIPPALAGILVVLFVAAQLIPVNRTNPSVTTQLNWDSQQTKTLAYRACTDCHSNETTWPWYSYIAPASWLVYYDVERGRSELNLSTYSASGGEARGNPFGPSGDLAYQLGQLLAGREQRGGPGGPHRAASFQRQPLERHRDNSLEAARDSM